MRLQSEARTVALATLRPGGPFTLTVGRRKFIRGVPVRLTDTNEVEVVARIGWISVRPVVEEVDHDRVRANLPGTGRGLRSWRVARRWTQEAAATALGLSRRTWIRNEARGHRLLTPAVRRALVRYALQAEAE